ncbi:MAG: PAS domain S-box protein [Acidobacteria bacterium]|nr:PAS domain S-box protein [Acidobacteriota bacterium]
MQTGKAEQTSPAAHSILAALRPGRLRIGARLTLSFIAIVLLMAAGYAIALWQFHELQLQQEALDRATRKSAAVLNLQSHLFAFRDRLEELSENHQGEQFVRDANLLREGMLSDIAGAKRALDEPPAGRERDSFVIVSLAAIESAVPVQVDAMADLAKAGDWPAIRLRSDHQLRQLNNITATLVNRVAAEVSAERTLVLKKTRQAEQWVAVSLLGAGSLTLLVAAALGVFVTRSITRPLGVLGRGAQALARGEFGYQVEVSGRDELGDLGRVFNRTASQLRELYANLQESEARFRSLIEHSSDFIFVIDHDGTVRYASPSSERALRLPLHNLTGRSIYDFIHQDDLPRARAALGRGAPDTIRTFEFRYGAAGGEVRTVEAVVTNLPQSSAMAGMVVNARDITERQLAQEELRRSEAFLAEGERLSHTGSWAWKPCNDEVTWSIEHHRIFGFELRKPSMEMFWERVHPEDRPRLRQALDKAIGEKGELELEFRIVLPDSSIRFVHTAGHAVVDGTGGLVELIGTTMDITERKRAEDALRQAHAEVAHVARAASMGELTASIAHEVSQPLTGIVVNATAGLRWLAAEPSNLEKVKENLERIARDGDRAGAVVTRIRAFFKKSAPKSERLDINETILEAVSLINGELRSKNITLDTRLAEGLPPVMGDRVQLQQVVLNLLVNGIEAMADTAGARILTVSTEREGPPDMIKVRVRDSGPGLDASIIRNLFDAFYTTKPAGMGMGLAICRSIIEAHRGRIGGFSNEGEGATFEFTLPAGDTGSMKLGSAP